MSGPRYQHTIDGQTVDEQDFNMFAEEAAKSEDWVFAEMLKLAPFAVTGSVAKAILPYYANNSSGAPLFIQPTTGGVFVWPFRAVIGPRILPNATTSDAAADTSPMLAYRDVRSTVFAGNTVASLGAAGANAGVTFTNGDPTNPRWDLVYASFTVDAASGTQTIFVKGPNASVGTPTSISRTLVQNMSLNVLTGTPSSSPAYPAVPADSSPTFYIPIAYVRIPANFTGSTVIQPNWINNIAPIVSLAPASGFAPAGGCGPNLAVTVANNNGAFQTWGLSGTRPSWWMSPMMGVGGKSLSVTLDANGAASTWNIPDGGFVDNSIDWRNRTFVTVLIFDTSASASFAMSHGNSAGAITIPSQSANAANVLVQPGQSFVADDNTALGITTRNGAVIAMINNVRAANWPAATGCALYVDMGSGLLKMYGTGTPARRAHFHIFASGQMENV